MQQSSSHPGLAVFSSINLVRLSPPNNPEFQIPPPSWAITLITPDYKDVEKQAPLPSSHHCGTGTCSFYTHKHICITTTTMIFSKLVWITRMYDPCYKNFWQLLLCLFLQSYIKICSSFCNSEQVVSLLHLAQKTFTARIPLVHVGSCRRASSRSVHTPQVLITLLPRLQTCSWHESSINEKTLSRIE